MLVTCVSAFAQSSPPEGGDYYVDPSLATLTPAERTKALVALKRDYPGFYKYKEPTFNRSGFPVVPNRLIEHHKSAPIARSPYLPDSTKTFWVNMTLRDSWYVDSVTHYGFYSFKPGNPINFVHLTADTEHQLAPHGVQYANGHLYGSRTERFYFPRMGRWFAYVYLSDYDTQTWEGTTTRLSKAGLQFIAQETAQADDGTVYGIFWDGNMEGRELCTIDYSHGEANRQKIGSVKQNYIALGITEANQLYGIAFDGNLYKINRLNGEETLVGPTGLTLEDSKGRVFVQTGEIDQTDDKFYWYATDADGNHGLYTVNLETGAATLIGEGDAYVTGMYIPAPAPSDGVPAKVDTAWVEFENAADVNGTLRFTAPTKSYAGNDLSGDLSYKVIDVTYKNTADSLLVSGTTTPGSEVSVPVSFKMTGYHKLRLTTSNSVGESQRYGFPVNVGYDEPEEVSDITLSHDSIDRQKVHISWNAPKLGVNGGNIDFANLRYTVYCIVHNDTTELESDIADTTYVDDVPVANTACYKYGVQAKTNTMESDIVWTYRGIIVGDSIDGGWFPSFTPANGDFDMCTVIDANKDGVTWKEGVNVISLNESDKTNDDWLITPALRFRKDYVYTLTFRVENFDYLSRYHNSMEVKWGKGNTIEAMTDTLFETFEPPFNTEGTGTTYKKEIVVSEDGNYNIGFHDNSFAGQNMLMFREISVEQSYPTNVPDSITNLAVTPGAMGEISASISFTTPEDRVNGDFIDQIDSIQIKRNGEVIANLTEKSAGENVTYTDTGISGSGLYTYDIACFVDGNNGRTASATVFVGKDIPTTPQNIKLLDNGDNILATWDKFSNVGSNGGYVNPDEVNVALYSVYDRIYVGQRITTSGDGETTATIPHDPEKATDSTSTTQEMYYVAARANSPEGRSAWVATAPVIIGPSIPIPFKESFKNLQADNGFVWLEGNEQFGSSSYAARWWLTNELNQDGDGGSVYWTNARSYTVTPGDEVSLNLPKVKLEGATNPVLYFYLYAIQNCEAKMKVIVAKPDGSEDSLTTYDLSTTPEDSWTQKKIDLSKYSSERWIIVKFRGIANGEAVYVALDNINIFDQPEHNFAVSSINVAKSVRAGSTATADVIVQNFGQQKDGDYDVVLYVDDEPVDTVRVSDLVDVLASDTVTVSFPVAANKGKKINVKAQVVLEDDAKASDDFSETKEVSVVPSEYTKVNDLAATEATKGISLAWSKPVINSSISVTEGFEDYAPFDSELGDWKLVDRDYGLAGGYFNGYSYPGQGSLLAYNAFNANAITDAFNVLQYNPGLAAHSGNQFAGAPYAITNTGSRIDADNWLISPELSGNKQTIKFYAFNIAGQASNEVIVYYEKFDVLYSTTRNRTSDFIKIESDTLNGTTLLSEGPNWKEFSVEIPEGAKYFAIRNNTDAINSFLFGIDDISFERATPGVNDSIIGYNIYLDGEKIASVKGDELAYTDEAVDEGAHVYNVTVVYQSKDGDVNESGFSNDASITVTGIEAVEANAEGTYDVYTIDGKVVRLGAKSLNGLSHGVYIINDRKYIIK